MDFLGFLLLTWFRGCFGQIRRPCGKYQFYAVIIMVPFHFSNKFIIFDNPVSFNYFYYWHFILWKKRSVLAQFSFIVFEQIFKILLSDDFHHFIRKIVIVNYLAVALKIIIIIMPPLEYNSMGIKDAKFLISSVQFVYEQIEENYSKNPHTTHSSVQPTICYENFEYFESSNCVFGFLYPYEVRVLRAYPYITFVTHDEFFILKKLKIYLQPLWMM